jgi:hypothetical protein
VRRFVTNSEQLLQKATPMTWPSTSQRYGLRVQRKSAKRKQCC